MNNPHHMAKIYTALNKEELAEKELISPKFLAPFMAFFRDLLAPFSTFSKEKRRYTKVVRLFSCGVRLFFRH